MSEGYKIKSIRFNGQIDNPHTLIQRAEDGLVPRLVWGKDSQFTVRDDGPWVVITGRARSVMVPRTTIRNMVPFTDKELADIEKSKRVDAAKLEADKKAAAAEAERVELERLMEEERREKREAEARERNAQAGKPAPRKVGR